MDEYDRGYYDALKWVYDHTGGDNYKLAVKDKMQEFIKNMDYEQLKAFTNNEIEPYLCNIEMWQCITALGIKPFKDGNQWSFLYGDNIQEGICGFGDTIDEAALDFYTNLKSDTIKIHELEML